MNKLYKIKITGDRTFVIAESKIKAIEILLTHTYEESVGDDPFNFEVINSVTQLKNDQELEYSPYRGREYEFKSNFEFLVSKENILELIKNKDKQIKELQARVAFYENIE